MPKRHDPANAWYGLARWQRRRRVQLRDHPLCRLCLQLHGIVTPANVADHVEPHHGDRQKFDHGDLQSLCTECHNAVKRVIEYRGYSTAIGADGWPVDKQHPCYGGARFEAQAVPQRRCRSDDDDDDDWPQRRYSRFGVPANLKPSRIPVTLVCGPPAAGKTTWVKDRASFGDTIIDLNDCKVLAGGKRWDSDPSIRARALYLRDQMLHGLYAKKTGRAFVIIGAPTAAERHAWQTALGVRADDVVILAVPAAVCIARLRTDPERSHAEGDLIAAVGRWHQLAGTAGSGAL